MEASDQELVALATALGDAPAFAELTRRHQPVVRSMLARLTGDAAAADDLAQDTFLRAYRRLATFEGTGSFRGWLCKIAYSEFLMARRKSRADARTLDALRETAPETATGAAWDHGDRLDLDRALAGLSEPERACVVLCYGCGMSHSEAADVMDLPLGTVKSHVVRGRAKLKAMLGADETVGA